MSDTHDPSHPETASTIDQSPSPSVVAEQPDTETTTRDNPIAEARRYRKRAQAAEKILEDLKIDLAAREKTISEHTQTIASLQRRQKMDLLLLDSDAVDLETARLLLEKSIAAMDEPDIEVAVTDLKERKPFLFRSTPRRGKPGPATGVQCARGVNDASPRELALDHAAEEAGATGKRTDLLRYLRLRRTR